MRLLSLLLYLFSNSLVPVLSWKQWNYTAIWMDPDFSPALPAYSVPIVEGKRKLWRSVWPQSDTTSRVNFSESSVPRPRRGHSLLQYLMPDGW